MNTSNLAQFDLVVVWPDGGGFNPGYFVAKNPSYPGIAEDYRRTHHLWLTFWR